MVLDRDCAVLSDQFSQEETGWFCVWEDLAFHIVDLASHGQWNIFPVRRQPPCSVEFACFGNPSLATRKGATVEVARATCHYCSSKLCLSFGPFEQRSLQQRQLCKNRNFGISTR